MIKRNIAIQYARKKQKDFLNSLDEFLAIPSVSTNPVHKTDMVRAAEFLKKYLEKIGMDQVRIFETPGHPIVYAESITVTEKAPTVLIYGHYDVQPPEPLDLWKSSPFKSIKLNDRIYARGSADMKGQVMACLFAVEAGMQAGHLPVNVKFLIEGEEEIGSPHLSHFLQTHKKLLSCDFSLNPDSGMIAADLPTITYALRGLAYFELQIYGPERDLHSGIFGGTIHNPAQVLCDLISGMHDPDGRITLPGFYDPVIPIDVKERAELARLPLGEDFYKNQTGAPELWGEPEYTPVERTGARPSLDVNGLYSGFTGEGSKTILPAYAMAKISVRLVPNQEPDQVGKQLREYLQRNAPKTVRWELVQLAGGNPSISDRNSEGVRALSKALEQVWGIKPVFKREGGSVPVVAQMQMILGVDSAMTGFGLPDANLHSPNENLHLPTWYRGIEAIIHFIYNLIGDEDSSK